MPLQFVKYDRTFLDASFGWLQDDELRYLIDSPQIDRVQQLAWFDSLPTKEDYMIWGISYEGRPIGACGLKHITSQDAEYWGYIGEKSLWGKGLGTEIIRQMEVEARNRGIGTLYLRVIKDNPRAIRLYQKCGFKEVESVIDIEMIKKL